MTQANMPTRVFDLISSTRLKNREDYHKNTEDQQVDVSRQEPKRTKQKRLSGLRALYRQLVPGTPSPSQEVRPPGLQPPVLQPAPILKIPEDCFRLICWYLRPASLFQLRQTCRGFRRLITTDLSEHTRKEKPVNKANLFHRLSTTACPRDNLVYGICGSLHATSLNDIPPRWLIWDRPHKTQPSESDLSPVAPHILQFFLLGYGLRENHVQIALAINTIKTCRRTYLERNVFRGIMQREKMLRSISFGISISVSAKPRIVRDHFLVKTKWKAYRFAPLSLRSLRGIRACPHNWVSPECVEGNPQGYFEDQMTVSVGMDEFQKMTGHCSFCPTDWKISTSNYHISLTVWRCFGGRGSPLSKAWGRYILPTSDIAHLPVDYWPHELPLGAVRGEFKGGPHDKACCDSVET